MILLLDTDILIDVVLDRAPHADHAVSLLELLEARPGTAFVAWHLISNFYYLVRPAQGHQKARDFLRELIRFVPIAPTTTRSLGQALQLEMTDFEDAMQVAAAMAAEADVIVTRNLRHYKKSPIRAAPPRLVMEEWAGD